VHQELLGLGVDRQALGQAGQVAHVQRLAQVQVAQIEPDRVGDRAGPAGHAEGMHQLLEHAALGHAGSRPAEVEPDVDLDRLVRADASEVKVDDVLAEVVHWTWRTSSHLGDSPGSARPGGSTV